MDKTADRLFHRALEAAAKALRDLDSDQVPADLRRVVGRPLPLPPPLAASLLKGLDRYDWLREKALEGWPEADVKAAGAEGASALLLLRPPGWVARVAVLAGDLGAEEARGAGDDLGRQLEVARAEGEEWKRRAKAESQERRREAAEARSTLAVERAARKSAVAAPARADAARRAELDRLTAEVGERTSEAEAAGWEARRLREALAEERRRRAAAERELSGTGGSAPWAGDPLSMAAHLDWTASMARLPAAPVPPAAGGEEAPLRLPEGVRPDQKAAVDWLARRSEGTAVVVDGYNAGFKMVGSRDPGAGRERVLMVLGRLQRVARGPLRVVVVFDSGLGPAADQGPSGPVEVRFTAEGGDADREIADLVAQLPGPRVVVSSDREVREAAGAVGAVALWSEALCEWGKRR